MSGAAVNTVVRGPAFLAELRREPNWLKRCRQIVTAELEPVSTFCAHARVSEAKLAEVEAGAAKPSQLLLAALHSRLAENLETAIGIVAELRSRRAELLQHLPTDLVLPEHSVDLPPLTVWQAARLRWALSRATQGYIGGTDDVFGGYTRGYISTLEGAAGGDPKYSHVRLSPPVLSMYLYHVTREAASAEHYAAQLHRAWEVAQALAPVRGLLPGSPGSEAAGAQPVPLDARAR